MKDINQLQNEKRRILAGGGNEKIENQHSKGKLTALERMKLLFDDNTFVPMDLFVKHRCNNFGMENIDLPGDGVLTGYGFVNGRIVYAYAQDFTVSGGSLGECHAEKIAKVQDYALKSGSPIVGMMDSGGARIQEGINALIGFGKMFYRNSVSSGVIPQISAIMGPCAGGAVYSPALTDFIFMVDKTSNMFITGPDVIKTVTGEVIDKEQLGGAMVHNSQSGVAHFIASNDEDCISQIRNLLSYLPSNNASEPQACNLTDDANRICYELNSIIPDSANKPYDMYSVIEAVADDGKVLDVQKYFARNIITCFIKLNGLTVGVVANNPKCFAGCLDINASDKAARFIRFCDCFNIPLLTFVDVPGFLPGTTQEHGGIIRHGAKLLYAYSEATVPKVTIITRKAYGGAYIGMCCKALGADFSFAWPSAEIAVMGASGACNIIFKKEIAAADNPKIKRNEKISEYEAYFNGPDCAASMGYIEDIIEPSSTRLRVINAFAAIEGKREELPSKKHGNIPV